MPITWEELPAAPTPLRVALAGLGTVGHGVYQWLASLPDRFTVAAVLVRDLDRARELERTLLTDDPEIFLACAPDLVIETIGGTGTAARLISAARAAGVPRRCRPKAMPAVAAVESFRNSRRVLWRGLSVIMLPPTEVRIAGAILAGSGTRCELVAA